MTINAKRLPTPAAIAAARRAVELSETAAGAVVYVSRESWRKYENGTTKMKLGLWELFLFKTGQLWIKPITEKAPRGKSRGRIENLRPFTARTPGAQ